MFMVPSSRATSYGSVFFLSHLPCSCPIYNAPYLLCLAASIAIPVTLNSSGKGTLLVLQGEVHTSRDLNTSAEKQRQSFPFLTTAHWLQP